MLKEAVILTAAAGCACLARSEYEKKHFSVETSQVVSKKLKKDRCLVFCRIYITMNLDLKTGNW